MILSKETTTGDRWNYRIWLNGGSLNVDIKNTSTERTLYKTDANYSDGQWYYVMFTRDNNNWHLYVNGVVVKTKTNDVTGTISNDQELWIGRSAFQGLNSLSTTGSYQYTGDIGQVFIYNRRLTAEEILHNFNVTKAIYGVA